MKKRMLLVPMAIVSSCLVSCNNKFNTITVWCDVTVSENMREQLANFKKLHPDCHFNMRLDTVSEANTASNMITDVDAGADAYIFVQDSFSRLYAAGALSAVPKAVKEGSSEDLESKLIKENEKSACEAAKLNDRYYAYPMTNDAGYFMYYNNSIINDKQVKSLEGIIGALTEYNQKNNANYKIYFPKGMWYTCSFFLSRKVDSYDEKGQPVCSGDTLCHSNWKIDDSGNFIDVDDTYTYTNGVFKGGEINPGALIASQGLYELLHSGVWEGDEDAPHTYHFKDNCACIIDGTWDYDTAVKTFKDMGHPDYLSMTRLPTFKVGGQDYQLGSLKGSKLLGIKSHDDANKAYWCAQLGSYLSGEECQRERYNYCKSYGPSNTKVLNEVKDTAPQLQAITYQNQYGTNQGVYPSDWYTYGDQKLIYGIRNMKTWNENDAKNILIDYAKYIKSIVK